MSPSTIRKPDEAIQYHWHLHDGTEAMYQEPLGRRTPITVIRVHNTMATVEVLSTKGRTRCSLRRVVRPTYAELVENWPAIAESITQPIGLIHNGMPQFFNALAAAVGGAK